MKIAVIGATGYTGAELLRILSMHPRVEVSVLTSDSSAGKSIAQLYPHVRDIYKHTLQQADPAEIAKQADLAFVALPGGLSSGIVPGLIEAGLKVIDLGGDFRLPASLYETWYKKQAPPVELQQQAVYGLSEWYAEEIAQANLITNPGCYPTATLLGLLPLVKHGLIELDSIVVDAKSGVSGAGKALSLNTHYPEINENLKAYKLGVHQHIPEIETQLARVAGEDVTISFTTHLVPMVRGILTTTYARLKDRWTTGDLLDLYQQIYEGATFVRIRPEGEFPATKEVATSNYCDIGLYVDERTKRVTVISVIDNLVKGASGQAVQNLNLMNGWDEATGLGFVPVYP
jgi:N-acetyl-gamma-glutamyl-phosphate reductase